ncbi:MAG: ribosome assembly cofactor RimP [Muribaculaceae bacterium]|nr:ribosome assembly cofactor RimP [Muribaculaceae bacterium]
MIDKKALTDVIKDALSGTDMFLVDLEVNKSNEITVEIDSLTSVDIESCVNLNRAIESKFDREVEDYQLEVGSAGLTSPFKVKAQYDKNIGNEVEVLTNDGRKLKGILKLAEETEFVIAVSTKEKPAGSKRPILVEKEETMRYDETKYTKYLIQFK